MPPKVQKKTIGQRRQAERKNTPHPRKGKRLNTPKEKREYIEKNTNK